MGFCGTNVWANGECVESTESELVSRYFDESYLYDTYIEKNTDSIVYINNPTGKEIDFLAEINAATIEETK
jgi:hypothetical protein